MKQILLVCSAGMSTSILVAKMQKVAEDRGLEVNIEAHANSDIGRFNGKVDVCMVGPQLKFAVTSIKESLPDIPVEAIDMRVYGLADGAKALDRAYELINGK
jgi:PTS system cellobiose-specific IIB component